MTAGRDSALDGPADAIKNMQIGIIGMGLMGRMYARRLSANGFR